MIKFFELLTKYVAFKYKVKADFEEMKAKFQVWVYERKAQIHQQKIEEEFNRCQTKH